MVYSEMSLFASKVWSVDILFRLSYINVLSVMPEQDKQGRGDGEQVSLWLIVISIIKGKHSIEFGVKMVYSKRSSV